MIVAVSGCLAAVPITAASFELDAAMRRQIETEAQRLIDQQHTPGLAIGIISDGQVIYAQGFGWANLETGTKVTPDSVFAIGSNTKQFTATAIMLLVERGKLALSDRLSKFFPDFPRGGEVTLRHLLTHSSGIHPVMVPGGLPTAEQRVNLRAAADLVPIIAGQVNLYDFEPGKGRRYSNSGYILLGVIIEKVSGLSLGEFFKWHLFEPAGMTATALDKKSEIVPNRASGYNRMPGETAFAHPPLLSDIATGGGGIRSTLGDMLRWQHAFLTGRIVSLESVKAMTMGDGEHGPFGVIVGEQNGHAVLSTGGGGPGFRSNVKIFPDARVGFVVMTNLGASQSAAPPELGAQSVQERPTEDAPTSPSPQKKGKGKSKAPQRNTEGAPNPAREMEQFLSRLISEKLSASASPQPAHRPE